MIAGEKQCPRCGETIKAAAYVCRFCGHEFAEAEVENAKRNAQFADVDQCLDELMARHGNFVTDDDCEEIADETAKTISIVKARAIERGLRVDEGIRFQGDDELRDEKLLSEARIMSQRGPLDHASTRFLATKYGLTERSVIMRLLKGGIATEYAESVKARAAASPSPAPVLTPTRENQYGVLQPAANLLGGCVNLWLWVILLFVLAVIVAVFTSLF